MGLSWSDGTRAECTMDRRNSVWSQAAWMAGRITSKQARGYVGLGRDLSPACRCRVEPIHPEHNEVVFYHPKSKTLLTTDTFWNCPRKDGIPNADYASMPGADQDFGAWELAPNIGDIPLGSRIWGKFGMDKLFRPFYLGLMIKSDCKDQFRRIASYISGVDESGWDVETVIPAHGDIIRGKAFCREVLKSHFNL